MEAVVFDTLEFAKRLREADFTEKQAETLVALITEIIVSRLVTKEDLAHTQHILEERIAQSQQATEEKIARLQQATEERIARLERFTEEKIARLERDQADNFTRLQRDLKETELRLKYDLTLRLGGMIAAAVAIVAALVKLL